MTTQEVTEPQPSGYVIGVALKEPKCHVEPSDDGQDGPARGQHCHFNMEPIGHFREPHKSLAAHTRQTYYGVVMLRRCEILPALKMKVF